MTIEEAAVVETPCRVHELDIVHKKGKLQWEMEVVTADGRPRLVEVDDVTGAVTPREENRSRTVRAIRLRARWSSRGPA